MKTIKELEETYLEDNIHNSVYERGLIALGKKQALKDVLELIDDVFKDTIYNYQVEELKKRING